MILKNGTVAFGQKDSYQWLLCAWRDQLKEKKPFPVYVAHMFKEKIKKAGLEAGLPLERIAKDWSDCHENNN